MVGLCNGMLLLLAQRARQDADGKKASGKIIGVQFDRFFFAPVWSQRHPQAHLSGRRGKAASTGQKDAFGNRHGICHEAISLRYAR